MTGDRRQPSEMQRLSPTHASAFSPFAIRFFAIRFFAYENDLYIQPSAT